MKTHLSGASRSLMTAALLSAVVQPALAQGTGDGGIDGSFTPTVGSNSSVLTLVSNADGEIIITGDFTQIKDLDSASTYQTRYRVAKFSRGGIMQAHAPLIGGPVLNAALEPDGSVLYMGSFPSVDGISRRHVARFLPSGTLDPSFVTSFAGNSVFNNITSISALARHGSGYIMASNIGTFRTNLTGAHDTTFNSYFNTVSAVNVVPGPARNFLINGPFVAVAPGETGVSTMHIKRLLSDGKIQTSPKLSHAVDREVYCVALQPDGRILVGGKFGGENSSYPSVGLTRLMPNGEIDEDFQEVVGTKSPNNPFFDGAVRSIALQADGRILVAGDFTSFRHPAVGQPRIIRRGVARLFPNGTLDQTFDAKIDPAFGGTPSTIGVSLQDDGKILIHGKFLTFNNGMTSRPKAARLTNYSATQELTYDGTTIRWVRGGSAPEARFVTLEHQSEATDFKWVAVDDGMAAREGTTSNWIKATSSPLPAGTLIRATANIAASQFNAGTSIVSSTIGYMVPKLGLMRDDPPAAILHNGSTNFPTTGVGSTVDVPFTLQNTGDGELTITQATLTGANASNFSFLIPPVSPISAGGTGIMEIRFNPTSTGVKTATLTINTNDTLLPAFKVTLTGTAIAGIEQFRLTHFGTTSNTGDAANDKDPDGDGLTNLFEYVAGLIPTDRTSTFSCSVDKSGSQPKVVFGPCLSNRNYEVWSSNTLNGDWALAVGTTTATGSQRTFTDSNTSATKRFYRVKITLP